MNTNAKMRKIYVECPPGGSGRESVWAQIISADTVRIQNIPFLSNAVAYEDVVRVSESGEVLEVLERTTRTWPVECAGAYAPENSGQPRRNRAPRGLRQG